MNLGADDYLTKPFDDLELLDAVEIRLRKSELIRKSSSTSIDNLDQISKAARGLKELEDLVSDQHKITKFKKKQILYSEGNSAHSLYFVVKGKVKTFKTNKDAREYITGLHKDGDFVGYFSLLENSYYSDSATVLEDSEICIIPKQEFFALLYSNLDIAGQFIKMLSNDIKESEERLLKLAYNSVRKRVAESLMMLLDNYKKENTTSFVMAVSREDLASLTGASKETVIRTLSDFKDEGLVQLDGSRITILQEAKLRSLKN